jgi:hypothetical protein
MGGRAASGQSALTARAATTQLRWERKVSKVFLHTRSPGKADWDNGLREFGRIPVIGEYVATDSMSDWFQVELVVHCPFADSDCEAEVYAVKVDHQAVMSERCPMEDSYTYGKDWKLKS